MKSAPVQRPGLRLRVGVNTGEVVAAEGGSGDAIASGHTVSTAARLEQSAEPGEVILELGTEPLVRDAVQAEALNPLDLRGKAGPTAAYRLIRVVGGEVHARRLDAPMVGRGSELDVLERSLERAIAGPSAQLVTIVGTAGVGKSRLVRAFLIGGRARARGQGPMPVVWRRHHVLVDRRDPPGPAGVDPASSREDAMALLAALVPPGLEGRDRIAGILESLVGESAVASAGDDIAWAVRRTLGALASANPLVLVVEDIHWAEPALLDLLGRSSPDWTTGARLLILCPARPELFDRRPDWGADRRNAVRLNPKPIEGPTRGPSCRRSREGARSQRRFRSGS